MSCKFHAIKNLRRSGITKARNQQKRKRKQGLLTRLAKRLYHMRRDAREQGAFDEPCSKGKWVFMLVFLSTRSN